MPQRSPYDSHHNGLTKGHRCSVRSSWRVKKLACMIIIVFLIVLCVLHVVAQMVRWCSVHRLAYHPVRPPRQGPQTEDLVVLSAALTAFATECSTPFPSDGRLSANPNHEEAGLQTPRIASACLVRE